MEQWKALTQVALFLKKNSDNFGFYFKKKNYSCHYLYSNTNEFENLK